MTGVLGEAPVGRLTRLGVGDRLVHVVGPVEAQRHGGLLRGRSGERDCRLAVVARHSHLLAVHIEDRSGLDRERTVLAVGVHLADRCGEHVRRTVTPLDDRALEHGTARLGGREGTDGHRPVVALGDGQHVAAVRRVGSGGRRRGRELAVAAPGERRSVRLGTALGLRPDLALDVEHGVALVRQVELEVVRRTLHERLVGGLVGGEELALDRGVAHGRHFTPAGAGSATLTVDERSAVLVVHQRTGVVDDVADGLGRRAGDGQFVERGRGHARELEALDDLDLALDEDVSLGGALLGLLDHDLVVALGVVVPAVSTEEELVTGRVELLVPDFLAVDVHVAGLEPHAVLQRDAAGLGLLAPGHALGLDVRHDLVLLGRLEVEAVHRRDVGVRAARGLAHGLVDRGVVGGGVAVGGGTGRCNDEPGADDSERAGDHRHGGDRLSDVHDGSPGIRTWATRTTFVVEWEMFASLRYTLRKGDTTHADNEVIHWQGASCRTSSKLQ